MQNQTVHDTFWQWWSGQDAGLKNLVVDGAFRSNPHCFGSPYKCATAQQ